MSRFSKGSILAALLLFLGVGSARGQSLADMAKKLERLPAARGFAQGEGQRTQQQSQKPLYGQFNIKPFKVIGNIYSVGMSETTSWLITTPSGHFIIAPLLPEMWPDIQKNIEELGFKAKDIKYILQDHSHRDHVAGIPALKALVPGAKVLVMAQDADVLAVLSQKFAHIFFP